jgi:hypothetical protein
MHLLVLARRKIVTPFCDSNDIAIVGHDQKLDKCRTPSRPGESHRMATGFHQLNAVLLPETVPIRIDKFNLIVSLYRNK